MNTYSKPGLTLVIRFLSSVTRWRLTFSLLGCLGLAGCGGDAPLPIPPEPTNQSAVAPNIPVEPKSEIIFQKLTGRWERPDGDYVLELRLVNAEGEFEAGYFNPSPIHIEQATASLEQGVVKLFVVLRDVNYPGCTYRLTYDPKADQLYGQYYQASMHETFDVAFVRQK